MTAHALERIAERLPGCNPQAVLASIACADQQGELVTVAVSLTGPRVTIWSAPNGACIFPVIAADGAVLTVLGDGMDFDTPTGRIVLQRPSVGIGVHRLPPETYHADPAPAPSLSSTLAKLILDRSPLHAWTAHPRLNPAWEPVEKKTFDIGRAAHRAVLGAGGDYVAYPADLLASNGAASTKEAKAWADEQRAAGRTPLKADEVDLVGMIADVVRTKLERMKITLDPARSELAAIAQIDGTWCRCMADNAPAGAGYLLDLKTTTDASPEGCIRAVTNYGFDVQAAHYLAVWEAATGERRKMRFVMVEKEPPYGVGVVELYDHRAAVLSGRASEGDSVSLDADWMADASAKVAVARETWADCLQSGVWPGYPDQVAVVGAPTYYRRASEARIALHPQKPGADVLRMARDMQAPERKAS